MSRSVPLPKSLRGAGAPRITAQQARLMACQLYGATRGISVRQTNHPGAFFSTRTGFDNILLIDVHDLSIDQHRALKRHGVTEDAFATVSKTSDLLLEFESPFRSTTRRVSRFHGPRRHFSIPILRLRGDKWALAALHAGILPKGRSLEQALEVFETKLAKSAHEALSMRRALTECGA